MSSPTSRSLLPATVVAVLLLAVFLLPGREDGVPAERSIDALIGLPALELDEPPSWALARGRDPVERLLDRLDWGGPMVLTETREALARHAGTLADEVLARLATLSPSDTVLASKLVALLAGEDLGRADVLAALERHALSESSLVAMAALRVLAQSPSERALDGVVARLIDADPDVAAHARAALASLARGGNAAARDVVLAELELPERVDLSYLAAVASFSPDARTLDLLARLAQSGDPAEAMLARTTQLRFGVEEAAAAFEEDLRSDDVLRRVNALRAIAASGTVLGADRWAELARTHEVAQLLPLTTILARAVDQGTPEALAAIELLEALAGDPHNPARDEILGLLYDRQHPWAIETTRLELQSTWGGTLGLAVDRIIAGPAELASDFVELAVARLADVSLQDGERGVLCRLLAHRAPARAADVIVPLLLQSVPGGQLDALLTGQLPELGEHGLARLQQQRGERRADAAFIRLAGELRRGSALPGLRDIALAPGTEPALRQAAIDAVARLREGPREAVLREIAGALQDDAITSRVRLLFWNYL